jgi:hypothetical protein
MPVFQMPVSDRVMTIDVDELNRNSFPWFFMFNALQEYIPKPDQNETLRKVSKQTMPITVSERFQTSQCY